MVSQLINKKVLSTLAFSYTVISIGKNKSNKFQKKISRGIGVLRKIRHFVDTKTLVQLYHAIILPFFSYGCIVWGNTYDHNIKPLQIIQRKAIRLLTFPISMHIQVLCLLSLTFLNSKIILSFKLSFLCTNLILANYQRFLIRFLLKHLANIM